MFIKGIKDEDFLQYKLPSMLVAFPSCTFKCEKECGCTGMCQNAALAKAPDIEVTAKDIVDRYLHNPISQALVCGGLEPLDSFDDLLHLINEFRSVSNDPVVIYTGYNKEEIQNMTHYFYSNIFGKVPHSYMDLLKKYSNVIIKYGRFIPNQEKHFDSVLGVELASLNQFAEIL